MTKDRKSAFAFRDPDGIDYFAYQIASLHVVAIGRNRLASGLRSTAKPPCANPALIHTDFGIL
jgi:hypothetical protein